LSILSRVSFFFGNEKNEQKFHVQFLLEKLKLKKDLRISKYRSLKGKQLLRKQFSEILFGLSTIGFVPFYTRPILSNVPLQYNSPSTSTVQCTVLALVLKYCTLSVLGSKIPKPLSSFYIISSSTQIFLFPECLTTNLQKEIYHFCKKRRDAKRKINFQGKKVYWFESFSFA
jgi:hypothetical protein